MIAPIDFDTLIQNPHYLSSIFNAIDVPSMVLDTTGQIIIINRACEALLHRNTDDVHGQFVWSLVGAEQEGVMKDAWEVIGPNAEAGELCNIWLETATGERHLTRWLYNVILTESNNAGYIVCTGYDITDQHQLREYAVELEKRIQNRTTELYRSKERVEAILNSSSDAIILTHLDGTIQQVNLAFDELFGFQQDEFFRLPMTKLVSSAYVPMLESTLNAVIQDHKPRRIEVVAIRKNGTVFVADIGLSLIVEEELKFAGTVCSMRDITQRKKTEAALRSSEARYRAVVEDQTELIFRYYMDGTLTFANGAYCRFFNTNPQSLVGQNFFALIPHETAELFKAHIADLNADNPVGNLEESLVSAEGDTRWLYWTNRAISDEEGRIVEYQAVGRDITEIKQAEIELRKALEKEKELVELKSRFIATTSHEFRTPLATILTTTASIQHYRHKMDDEQLEKRFNKITGQVQHLTALLEDVLTVEQSETKRLVFKPTMLDLPELCGEIAEEFQRIPDMKHQIHYSCNLNELSPETYADQKLLRQLITNMVSNAIKYSPSGRNVYFDVVYEAEEITLRFRDEGIGIPKEDQPRLFEVFHRGTNVNTIAGTGLGLAIARQAVELHGGTITFESEVGQGTTFIITIPYRPSGDSHDEKNFSH